MTEDSLLSRLGLLDQYLQDLRESQPRNFEAYESDKMLRRYTERMLQMAAETCIHIGIGILTQEGYRHPENYHDIFIVLGEHGILPRELVDAMTAMVELRNLLVYEQAGVGDIVVYSFVRKHLDDLYNFSNVVRDYLHRRADGPALNHPLDDGGARSA